MWDRLGATHPDVARAMHNLSHITYLQKDFAEAENLEGQAIATWEHLLPENHPDLAGAYLLLGKIKHAKGEYGEAEKEFHRALQIRRTVFNPDHHLITASELELGSCLISMRRFQEAETLLLKAHSRLSKNPDAPAENTKKVLLSLHRLYEDWGKPELAGRYRERLENLSSSIGNLQE